MSRTRRVGLARVGLTENRKTPQDVARRRKIAQTPIRATRLCAIACFIRQCDELKPMNERKMQRKYKIETAKMHISIPAQDATLSQTAARRRKTDIVL